MEGELWEAVYRLILGEACDRRNWPDAHRRCRDLLSDARICERLRTLSVLQLLAAVLDRLASLAPPAQTLVRAVDGKPLPVGGYSKDRDARWGKSAADGWEKGYKMFDVWGEGVVPDC